MEQVQTLSADVTIDYSILIIVGRGNLITIEDLQLSANGYQLLPLAASQLVGDNKEFHDSGIFPPVELIVGKGQFITIEGPSLIVMVTNCCPL